MAGAIEATEHLLELGHRRIGLIKGIPDFVATEERASGYRAALTEAGVPLDPRLEVCGEFDTIQGRRCRSGAARPPGAADGDLRLQRRHGGRRPAGGPSPWLDVPEDLSVVGFDDSTIARIALPAITTVRQPLEEIGRMAATLLTRMIDGQKVDPIRLELGARLVVRDSTAPVQR